MKNEPHRPNVIIDWNEVDKLLDIGCKGTDIADALGICSETLYLKTAKEKGVSFSAYYQRRRANYYKKNLRQAQYDAATKGSVPMLIWLGKQDLDQKEPEAVVSEQNKSALVEYLEKQKREAGSLNEETAKQTVSEFSVLEMQKKPCRQD